MIANDELEACLEAFQATGMSLGEAMAEAWRTGYQVWEQYLPTWIEWVEGHRDGEEVSKALRVMAEGADDPGLFTKAIGAIPSELEFKTPIFFYKTEAQLVFPKSLALNATLSFSGCSQKVSLPQNLLLNGDFTAVLSDGVKFSPQNRQMIAVRSHFFLLNLKPYKYLPSVVHSKILEVDGSRDHQSSFRIKWVRHHPSRFQYFSLLEHLRSEGSLPR